MHNEEGCSSRYGAAKKDDIENRERRAQGEVPYVSNCSQFLRLLKHGAGGDDASLELGPRTCLVRLAPQCINKKDALLDMVQPRKTTS